MPIRKHNKVVSAELTVQPNNEEKLYCEMADGTDISYIDDIEYRKFFSRLTKEVILLFYKTENFTNELLSQEDGPFYDNEEYIDDIPKSKNLFCYILDAHYVNDEDDDTIEVDIAFSDKCIKTFVVDIGVPMNKMEEEIQEIVGETKSLNSIKFKPFFIRLGKVSVFDEFGEILRFRRLNDKCFNNLIEIVRKNFD